MEHSGCSNGNSRRCRTVNFNSNMANRGDIGINQVLSQSSNCNMEVNSIGSSSNTTQWSTISRQLDELIEEDERAGFLDVFDIIYWKER